MLGNIEYDKEADVEGNVRVWNNVSPIVLVNVAELFFVQVGWSFGNPIKYGFDDCIFIGRMVKVSVVSKGW